jgi:hypothetical protein
MNNPKDIDIHITITLEDVAKCALLIAAWVCAIYGDWNGFGIVMCMGFALGCMLKPRDVEEEKSDL